MIEILNNTLHEFSDMDVVWFDSQDVEYKNITDIGVVTLQEEDRNVLSINEELFV